MTVALDTPSLTARFILIFLILALTLMVGVLLKTRLTSPSLTIKLNAHEMHFAANQETIPQDMDEISALMQSVAKNPNDVKLVLKLAETLMQAEQWEPALNFAKRAQNIDPKAFEPVYLQGIILHRQGRYSEAATTLEGALNIRDDAACRYSLGILYSYFLNAPDIGERHLKAALLIPSITPNLKATIENELNRQKQKKEAK
ncbi:MAG: hypothetical protein IJT59_03860 [Desulfovibrionaceae bacterium]|nr:hypothetical protein [Desulfovibrionaceae bacterium]